ncbi:MAG: hypothetical protein ACYSWU_21480 [Planctomycetota bacterium]|jgi:hypothetical protein
MWPFKRTSIPKVKLTNLAYGRWLRANKPPFEWFLARDEDEQETLATIGDEFTQEIAIAYGYAAKDPVIAEAGIEAMGGDGGAEDTLLKIIAEKAMQAAEAMAPAVSQPPSAPTTPAPPRPKSFGEFGATREELSNQVRGPLKTPMVFGVETSK